MPTTQKKVAAKNVAAKKVTVRKSAAKPAAKPAAKKAAKPAAKKSAAKESTWVTQSTVAFSEEVGASRFTTQTQRRLLREIVAAKSGTSFAEAKPATLRSLGRLRELGLVTVTAKNVAKATERGRKLVA